MLLCTDWLNNRVVQYLRINILATRTDTQSYSFSFIPINRKTKEIATIETCLIRSRQYHHLQRATVTLVSGLKAWMLRWCQWIRAGPLKGRAGRIYDSTEDDWRIRYHRWKMCAICQRGRLKNTLLSWHQFTGENPFLIQQKTNTWNNQLDGALWLLA